MDKNFQDLERENNLKILITYRPEQIETHKKYSFDLVVLEHANSGQVRIHFMLNELMAPNQGWFPPYARELYKHDSLIHIVSRGISFSPRLPRVFNPLEIVVIDIL